MPRVPWPRGKVQPGQSPGTRRGQSCELLQDTWPASWRHGSSTLGDGHSQAGPGFLTFSSAASEPCHRPYRREVWSQRTNKHMTKFKRIGTSACTEETYNPARQKRVRRHTECSYLAQNKRHRVTDECAPLEMEPNSVPSDARSQHAALFPLVILMMRELIRAHSTTSLQALASSTENDNNILLTRRALLPGRDSTI